MAIWRPNIKIFIFWFILSMAALLRVASSNFLTAPDIGECLNKIVSGIGIVYEEPVSTETAQNLVIRTEKLNSQDGICEKPIKIKARTKLYPKYSYGDKVIFSGKINEPLNFSGGDTGRVFDYRNYLAKDDIFYEIKSAATEMAGKQESFLRFLFFLKHGFVTNLQKILGEPHAALAAGLVVGEKSALGKDLLNDFRTVGLIHIIVLSGFNITIVGDAIRKILSFLPRVWGIVLGGFGIILFGTLVGGGATVVRSCFMAGIALTGDLLRRDYNVARALVFAGLVMIIQSPMILLHDPSFQLSFLATLGLILLASPIEKRLIFISEKFGLRGIVASTFATQIFVSPYILYMMGQISLIGVIVNILVLPLIPITMLFVFLTGISGFFAFFAMAVFGWICHFLLSYELFMVNTFAKVPYAALFIPAFSFVWVVVFYICFAATYLFRTSLLNSLSKIYKKQVSGP